MSNSIKILGILNSRYGVTKDGRVYSIINQYGFRDTPKELKLATQNHGYKTFVAYLSKGIKKKAHVQKC